MTESLLDIMWNRKWNQLTGIQKTTRVAAWATVALVVDRAVIEFIPPDLFVGR